MDLRSIAWGQVGMWSLNRAALGALKEHGWLGHT